MDGLDELDALFGGDDALGDDALDALLADFPAPGGAGAGAALDAVQAAAPAALHFGMQVCRSVVSFPRRAQRGAGGGGALAASRTASSHACASRRQRNYCC